MTGGNVFRSENKLGNGTGLDGMMGTQVLMRHFYSAATCLLLFLSTSLLNLCKRPKAPRGQDAEGRLFGSKRVSPCA